MDSDTLSLKKVSSTSAQMALFAALIFYQAIYGKVTDDTEAKQFTDRMRKIIDILVVDETRKTLKKRRSLLPCKLNRIDDNGKIILSNRGKEQIDNLLKYIAIDDAAEQRRANRYESSKASPLSTRRISIVASLWAVVSFDTKTLIKQFNEAPIPNDASYASDAINGLFYLTVSGLLTYFIIGNGQKWARQERTNEINALLRQSLVKGVAICLDSTQVKESEDAKLPSTQEALCNINKNCNIDQYKGYISAHSSKSRKRISVTASLLLSTAFITMDIIGLGIPIAVRFGLAGAVGLIAGCVRYYAKYRQNREKLFVKTYNDNYIASHQTPLISYLSVYGLQPAKDASGKIPTEEVAVHTLGVKRQVQYDVDSFLANYKIINHNNQLVWYNQTMKGTAKTLFICPSNQPHLLLAAAKKYAEDNTPPNYQGCNTYFVKEVVFQLREQLGEPAHEVDADREDTFCRPTADFFAHKHTKGIKYNHQLMQIHKMKTELAPTEGNVTQPKNSKSPPPPLEDCSHLKHLTRADVNQALSKHFLGTEEINEENLKSSLKKYPGFAKFKQSNYLISPTTSLSPAVNERMLNAYYDKIYVEQERRLYEEQAKSTDPFNQSSRQLFNNLIKHEPQRKEFEINMAGVFESSVWSALRASLIACIPLFGFTMQSGNTVLDLAETGATSIAVSGGLTHASIHHARSIKREARANNARAPGIFSKACLFMKTSFDSNRSTEMTPRAN